MRPVGYEPLAAQGYRYLEAPVNEPALKRAQTTPVEQGCQFIRRLDIRHSECESMRARTAWTSLDIAPTDPTTADVLTFA
jgi:hypothetical protein